MRQFMLSQSGDADQMFAEADVAHAFDWEALVLPNHIEEGVDGAGEYALYIESNHLRDLSERDYSSLAGTGCAGCGSGDALEILDLDADALWIEGNRVFHNLECVGLTMQEIVGDNSP